MPVYCLYVEKKPEFAVEAGSVLSDLRATLKLDIENLRILNRYLVEGISRQAFDACRHTVFSEPQVDLAMDSLPDLGDAHVFATELLPGQFDQRADSCAQCISLSTGEERPTVRCAKIWALKGSLSRGQLDRVKGYLINPVESREASREIPATLDARYPVPAGVSAIEGFTAMGEQSLSALIGELGLAMDTADLVFCRDYFRDGQRRDPTLTELRMIDTYWSDHCRHTTFLTNLEEVDIRPERIRRSFERYLELRRSLGRGEKPVTLMDIATIGVRALRAKGGLSELDESDEINACSVRVKIEVDGRPQDWLLMFKNETHNHPTEIEPFGGAATCLGGAIRDPLSGRAYVYQAMRITGAADPTADIADTRPGKLPQKKLCQTAAAGYSSYGNQIGLATGLVNEIYHPGYGAKRMELGAVIGAAPAGHVVRQTPQPGDKIILLGGRTGRDGCGGATGSSKSHTAQSLETCGSEVQKGNAPEERKIQRLFRNPEATRLIRRCNDFGAGGVCVAIGELADGVEVDLDAVPLKYEGLDGTELTISESQERMAAVVAAEDAQRFIQLAGEENLEATVVAMVTRQPRLVMRRQGKVIADLSREFLSSNGAPKRAGVKIPAPAATSLNVPPVNRETLTQKLSSLEFCSQKGLSDRFDSTVGAGSVLLPFGGKYQRTPAQVMAAKLPVDAGGETSACSLMSWAFDPHSSSLSPYHAGIRSVAESVARVVAAGGSRSSCWLTFQEYFEKLGASPEKWGKPAAALLGALEAQLELGVAAIGGKDSMSGSFEDISVPPTLVSIAVSLSNTERVLSGEFKRAGSRVYLLSPKYDAEGLPDFASLRSNMDAVEGLTAENRLLSAWAVGTGGTAQAVFNMCLGNRIGFRAARELSWEYLPGSFVVESKAALPGLEDCLLGNTVEGYTLELSDGEAISLDELQAAWEGTLQPVYPYLTVQDGPVRTFSRQKEAAAASPEIMTAGAGTVKAAIPVFPGTNCEYDTQAAFERAGIKTELFVLRNRTGAEIEQSARAFAELVARSRIVALPGGFSGGDEPEGSGKFITAFLRNPAIRAEIENLLFRRDGLMLGICNGFQALVKLGLVPFGEYREMRPEYPTLTYNVIGRHQSVMVNTRISSSKSPWLSGFKTGEVYPSPVSNGEGRFIADEKTVLSLAENGQIATQYVDFSGAATMDIRFNPSGSAYAIEGVTSPDGRVFGKMAHVERYRPGLYKNHPDYRYLDIFRCAADYYRI